MSNNLLAVSGGADSMYLLCHYDGIVAHFNHKMRDDSDDDAKFVWDWCRSHDRICVIGEASGPLNSEEEARVARYQFLFETADELSCDYILTAHNMNDNAETVILNMTRGTGLKGLCGIPENRDRLRRPMLGVLRSDIEKYLKDNDIPYVTDKTNLTDDYNRNLIRHKVIPELEKINPKVVESIYRMSQLLIQDEDYISSQEYSEHPAKLSRFIRDNCPKALTFDQVQAVLNMGSGYSKIDLPGITVVKDRGKYFFSPEKPVYSVTTEEVIVNKPLTNNLIDSDLIKGDLTLSSRQPGDKYRPLGRNCTKSLKSLFLEADLTQEQRDAWPILRDDEGIVWVYKFGIDERVATKPGNKAIKVNVEEK